MQFLNGIMDLNMMSVCKSYDVCNTGHQMLSNFEK